MKQFSMKLQYDGVVATWPEGVAFPVEIKDGEARFEMRTSGPWHVVTRLRGLAITHGFKDDTSFQCHGVRSLQRPREDGYDMVGRCSVGGRSRRAFTSSQLFMVDGKLVSVAVLFVTNRERRSPRGSKG